MQWDSGNIDKDNDNIWMLMLSASIPNQNMCDTTKQKKRYRLKETERQISKETQKLLDRNHLSEIVRWSIWESLAKLISAKLFSQQVFSRNYLILDARSKQLKFPKKV